MNMPGHCRDKAGTAENIHHFMRLPRPKAAATSASHAFHFMNLWIPCFFALAARKLRPDLLCWRRSGSATPAWTCGNHARKGFLLHRTRPAIVLDGFTTFTGAAILAGGRGRSRRCGCGRVLCAGRARLQCHCPYCAWEAFQLRFAVAVALPASRRQ